MPTVQSSASSFCTVAQLLKRIDVRTAAQLASDTNVPVEEASLPANANVLQALSDASGEIEVAAAKAGYTTADLAAIAGSGTIAQSQLERLTCGVAIWFLFDRRPMPEQKMPAMAEWALGWMDKLVRGERIFPLEAQREAQAMQAKDATQDEIAAANRTTFQMGRFFARRSDMAPPRRT